jgi:hypothetical protein
MGAAERKLPCSRRTSPRAAAHRHARLPRRARLVVVLDEGSSRPPQVDVGLRAPASAEPVAGSVEEERVLHLLAAALAEELGLGSRSGRTRPSA